MIKERALQKAYEMTQLHKQLKSSGTSIAKVESECMKVLYPYILDDLQYGEIFVGKNTYQEFIAKVGIQALIKDYELSNLRAGNITHLFVDEGLVVNVEYLKNEKANFENQYHSIMEEMIEYWQDKSFHINFLNFYKQDKELNTYVYDESEKDRKIGEGGVIMDYATRQAGCIPDYDKLLRLGVCGLREEIIEQKKGSSNAELDVLNSLENCVDIIDNTIDFYLSQAKQLLKSLDKKDKYISDLKIMVANLEQIRTGKPQTLKQAIQLVWIYSIISDATGYGRIDVYLGDFVARDLKNGEIDEAEIQRCLLEFYDKIHNFALASDGRMVVGGKGRRNESNADLFAKYAIRASKEYRHVNPVLSLRLYKGMNEEIWEEALDSIQEGALYPFIYNDEELLDGAKEALATKGDDNLLYYPLGCGEFILEHMSIGSPNSAITLPKAVEVVLCNGGEYANPDLVRGLKTGTLDEFTTFDKFYSAVLSQIEHHIKIISKIDALRYEKITDSHEYVFLSLLYDDCIKRKMTMLAGGVKYKGVCIEGFGHSTAGDAIYAVKKGIYEDKYCTLVELSAMLRANWVGFEKERKYFLSLAKYGNNLDEVDSIVKDLYDKINVYCKKYAKMFNHDYVTFSNVNPGGVRFGFTCGATPCGRKSGDAFAIGNSPTAGRDTSGLFNMLSSVAKPPAVNGGMVTNIKLSKDLFRNKRKYTSDALRHYFDNGGKQLNITCVNKEDLQLALNDPENYRHILVRVGGFSAIFVDLEKKIQMDIINRTLHE